MLNNLAELYRATGRLAEAEPLYERVLAILEKALPPDHPHQALFRENYAILLDQLGRSEEAAGFLPVLRRSASSANSKARPPRPADPQPSGSAHGSRPTVPFMCDNGTVCWTGPMKRQAETAAAEAAPTTLNGTVPPRRQKNADVRPREYLTLEEVERLIVAAKARLGRHGHRDATLILIAYRHGLRASELTAMRWDQLDFHQGQFHVRRLKNGRASVHLLRGSELRALRRLQREQVPPSPYVFTTERKTPMTAAGFRKLMARIGQAAAFPFPVHPHMLRHACGFKLAHDGHDTRALQEWLGHRNIQHTTRYTELTSKRFRDFWQQED